MKHQKGIGVRVLLTIVAITLGLGLQVSGSGFSRILGIAAIEYIFGLLGFIVMGYCVYKWAIR